MESQLPEFVIAKALAHAARDVAGVVDLFSGRLGEIATYGRGGRVPGVRVWREDGHLHIEAHIVAAYPPEYPLPTLADDVRGRLRELLPELGVAASGPIDVIVADVRLADPPSMMGTA
jgi:uncharacterized alkaline shock family protein YloU